MSLRSKIKTGVKKFNPKKSNKLSLASFVVAFAAIGGIIALFVTSAAVPLVEDASVTRPSNVRTLPQDQAVTVEWDHVERDDIVGYYIKYKKKGTCGTCWENTKQTVHNSIQLQPLTNGQEYDITVQSARGAYQAVSAGPLAGNTQSATNYWARADGHVSPVVTATGTPSSAHRDAQAARLTGFFDDFNEPANPFDEIKWNQAAFCRDEPFNAMAFINPQFHSHNAIRCGFGGVTSRPRAVWDTSVGVNGSALSESNPAQIEFDMDMTYDGRSAWYLDLFPLDSSKDSHLKDIVSHHDIHNDDDSDPPNLMRIQAGGDGMYYNWYDLDRNANRLPLKNNGAGTGCWGDDRNIDFRGCDMTRKTGNFSAGLAEQTAPLYQSAQNVRRHWVIQITPTRMKTFVDNVLIADAQLPQAFAAKRKFIVQNTMFSYNTGKDFTGTANGPYGQNSAFKGRRGVYPYFHFYHWDNFGFTGPAPTTVVHNYVDSGSDGSTPNYLLNNGNTATSRNDNRSTIVNIPDDIGNPIGGKAKLYYTLIANHGAYKWSPGSHFILNGRRYDIPNFVDNMQNPPPHVVADGIPDSGEQMTIMHEVSVNDLRKGNNTLVFNMPGGPTWYTTNGLASNLHIELEYTKGSEPSYTQPIDYFRSKSAASGALFSKIVEPPMTNCDSYIYIEQDLGLPKFNSVANLEPAPCYLLSTTPGHAGHSGEQPPTPVPAPDTTAPTITLTDPINNHTITGSSVVARATATDNVSVNRVEFYAGSPATLVGTDTTAGTGNTYEAPIDMTSYAPGTYPIYAVAIDSSGIRAQTSSRNVIKPQPADTGQPTASLTSPANNFQVANGTSDITLSANATDNVGVTRVEFWVDNAQVIALTTPTSGTTYSHTIQAGTYQAGSHSWYIIARDAAGNFRSLQSSARSFIIPTPPPATCPTGQTGTPPNCVVPAPPTCPTGQTGTPPNCVTPPAPTCPTGQIGTPPNCTTPPTPTCPSGQVGTPPNCTTPIPTPTPTPNKPGDINGDGRVNREDLRILLFYYGRTVTSNTNGDLDNNGRVNRDDLRVLLWNYLR